MTDTTPVPVLNSASLLKLFMDVLDHATDAPPPKKEGLDGRKGLARRMVLSVIDDIMRLDADVHGADWSQEDIIRLKDKAIRALSAMNNVD